MTLLGPEIRILIEAVDDPLCVVSSDCAVQLMNRSFAELLGLPIEKTAGVSLLKFWPDASSALRTAKEVNAEFLLGAARIKVRLSVNPLGGGTQLLRVLPQDKRNSVLENFHSQRLETLGMLAGGIAHDFNNMLAGILGHVSYLTTILPERGIHRDSLAAIEDGAKKASGMVQQILGFSKLESEEKIAVVDLCDLAKKTKALLRGAISPAYEINCLVPEAKVSVLGVEAKIAQVIANLVINARDALGADGTIKIAVDVCSDPKKLSEVFAGKDLSSKEYAVLSVEDDGHGMSDEVKRKAFDPYFSTKKDKGTGLGLATVQAIVRSFGGAIEVYSKVDDGTKISAYLPMVESPKNQAPKGGGASVLKGGKERILVVDDEYPVRNVLSISLGHLGYQVSAAGSGEEAISLYELSGGFDLVIMDMLMPVMPGEKLFANLKSLDPNLRVLVMSGFSSEAAVQEILKGGGLGFMQKPFTIDELSRRVRECLDAAR